MKNPTLSVIMPALNEEKNIRAAIETTLSAFRKYGIDGEIIVINDGSTDNTRQIVEEMSQYNSSICLINHNRPQGVGNSFWHGATTSKKDVVVMFPGDNENDPENALEFFYLMNNVDMVVPFIVNTEIRGSFRKNLSLLYRTIINTTFGVNLNYTNGTVFYRRAILEGIELKNSGFLYQAELLIKLIRKGYLFAEIPNYLGIRSTGKSKALTLKSLIKVMKGYMELVYDIHMQRNVYRKNYRKLSKDSISLQKYENFQKESLIDKNISYNE